MEYHYRAFSGALKKTREKTGITLQERLAERFLDRCYKLRSKKIAYPFLSTKAITYFPYVREDKVRDALVFFGSSYFARLPRKKRVKKTTSSATSEISLWLQEEMWQRAKEANEHICKIT